MPYITREDGEHFVIPSYRDVLTVKQKTQLKKDILALSQSYGEYITLQKKGNSQYEVAFSPDTGYLLGESIWHYFKRPLDMIYCEAIPNTTEALLVIVKSGSVYLDGSFPVESIPEELVIFLTQQNNFDIYVYGDVPISASPEDGKFSFEESSVKSFNVLDKPVFPTLPLLRIYQLQLVDQVLKAHGIGVFPTKQIVMAGVAMGLVWMIYSYLTSTGGPQQIPIITRSNPYQQYLITLNTPAPDEEVNMFTTILRLYLTMPGWMPDDITYTQGKFTASVKSQGGRMEDLLAWAKSHQATVDISSKGVSVSTVVRLAKRPFSNKIYSTQEVVAMIIDKLAIVYPGNHLKIGEFVNHGNFKEAKLTIELEQFSPAIILLLGQQFKGLPVVLQSISMGVADNNLTGSIIIQVVGS